MTERRERTAPATADYRYLTREGPDWPAAWPPDVAPGIDGLHAQGDVSALGCRCLGIVGTRRPTARGLEVTRVLAGQLAAAGWIIVSGLARGIDAAAHRGALEAGGRTVAVMATGTDVCYPHAHRGLVREIRAHGCTVTPFPAGTPPLKYHFLQRNQVLALLVEAVVVVEAPLQSGAMVTAREAGDAGREVFAVPGPVDVETSRGCHQLLRDGAGLVETTLDILRGLRQPVPAVGSFTPPPAPPLPDHAGARWLYGQLDLGGCGREELRRRWPGDERAFSDGLTVLELAGLIHRLPGGRVARRLWTA